MEFEKSLSRALHGTKKSTAVKYILRISFSICGSPSFVLYSTVHTAIPGTAASGNKKNRPLSGNADPGGGVCGGILSCGHLLCITKYSVFLDAVPACTACTVRCTHRVRAHQQPAGAGHTGKEERRQVTHAQGSFLFFFNLPSVLFLFCVLLSSFGVCFFCFFSSSREKVSLATFLSSSRLSGRMSYRSAHVHTRKNDRLPPLHHQGTS